MKRWEIVSIGLILAIGAFLRLYRLPETLMFRGDQGRDAIIARNILKEGDIALIGPVTSVGNMYLGPLYYYFMVPFLATTYPDPVGPAYGVALLSILTIYLIYWVGKKTINAPTGIMAALLFAVMPSAIIYGRFSWNPNIAPFFSILIFYTLHQWWQLKSLRMFFITSVLTGLLAQTHYVSLTVVSVIGLAWVARLIKDRHMRSSLKELVVGLVGFLLTMLPLIVFDFRHNHLISQQFIAFFTSPEKHMRSTGLVAQLGFIADKAENLVGRLLYIPGEFNGSIMLLIVGVVLGTLFAGLTRNRLNSAVNLIWLWLLTAMVGTSFYSHSTYVHYLTYCFPLIALFWGHLTMAFAHRRFFWGGLGIAVIVLWISVSGLPKVGWSGLGTRTLSRTVEQAIPEVTTPYNITLLSDDKDYKGMSYRYFFEVSEKKPLSADDYGALTTLVIIDETFLENPLEVPIYEIQAAKDFTMEKKIIIPQGPWVYIYKKG